MHRGHLHLRLLFIVLLGFRFQWKIFYQTRKTLCKHVLWKIWKQYSGSKTMVQQLKLTLMKPKTRAKLFMYKTKFNSPNAFLTTQTIQHAFELVSDSNNFLALC